MSNIPYLKNQFQSINTFAQSYDYAVTLIRREKRHISFLRIEWSLFVSSSLTKVHVCFVPSVAEIGPKVLERKIFKFLLFRYYLPFIMGVPLYLNKSEPTPKDALFQ